MAFAKKIGKLEDSTQRDSILEKANINLSAYKNTVKVKDTKTTKILFSYLDSIDWYAFWCLKYNPKVKEIFQQLYRKHRYFFRPRDFNRSPAWCVSSCQATELIIALAELNNVIVEPIFIDYRKTYRIERIPKALLWLWEDIYRDHLKNNTLSIDNLDFSEEINIIDRNCLSEFSKSRFNTVILSYPQFNFYWKKYIRSFNNDFGDDAELLRKMLARTLRSLKNPLKSKIKDDLKSIIEAVNEDIKFLYEQYLKNGFDVQMSIYKKFAEKITVDLDWELQSLILGEVIEFLCTNEASSILEDLIAYSYFTLIDLHSINSDLRKALFSEEVINFLCTDIATRTLEELVPCSWFSSISFRKIITNFEEDLLCGDEVCLLVISNIINNLALIPWAVECSALNPATATNIDNR